MTQDMPHEEAKAWESLARDNGWCQIGGQDDERVLFHPRLDRVWPADDWKGACQDIGFGLDELGHGVGESAA